MYICWLFLWCIHRRKNNNDPELNNLLARTFDEFHDFIIGCNNYSITHFIGYGDGKSDIGYDTSINNQNRGIVNDTNVVVDSDDTIIKRDIIPLNNDLVDSDVISSSLPTIFEEILLSQSDE